MSLLRRIEKGGGSGGGDNPPRDPGGETGAPEGGGDESRLAAMRARNQQVMGRPQRQGGGDGYVDLKTRVQNRLLSELDQSMDLTRKTEVRAHIEELFNASTLR